MVSSTHVPYMTLYRCVVVRGAAAPKGPMTYADLIWASRPQFQPPGSNKNSIGHRLLRGRCPFHHLTPSYTHLRATGTADHLTLLRLLSILLPSCPPSFSLSFFLVFPPPFLFLISLTLFCLFSNPSRENQFMSLSLPLSLWSFLFSLRPFFLPSFLYFLLSFFFLTFLLSSFLALVRPTVYPSARPLVYQTPVENTKNAHLIIYNIIWYKI